MPELDYHKDVKIDPLNLVEEWGKQADLYYDYGIEWAEAVKLRDILEAQIARKDRTIRILRSKIDLEIRADPAKYGLKEKPSEASIRAVVLSQCDIEDSYDELFDKQEELAELQYDVNALEKASWGFVHRKDALDKITTLFLNNYYATQYGVSDDFQEQVDGLKKTMPKNKKEG